VDCQLVDRPLRFVFAPELVVEQHDEAAEPAVAGVLVDRTSDQILDLRQPTLLAAEDEHRHSVRETGVPALGPLAEALRLFDEPLCLAELTAEKLPDAAHHGAVPLLRGLPQQVGEALVLIREQSEPGGVSARQVRDVLQPAGLERALVVARFLGQSTDLVRDRHELLGIVPRSRCKGW
jgi:hypothetical protein